MSDPVKAAAAVLIIAWLAFSAGYGRGYRHGTTDAPSYNEVLAERAAATREWEAAMLAEPSDRERVCEQILDLAEPLILDGAAVAGAAEPDRMDGR